MNVTRTILIKSSAEAFLASRQLPLCQRMIHSCATLYQNDPSSSKEKDDKVTREKTLNQVTLLGRCGSDPQHRGTERLIIAFPLGTSSQYETKDGDVLSRQEWHQITVFKPRLAEYVSKYLTKGRRVLVNGKLQYGAYEDKEGVTRNTTTIAADEIIFLDGPRKTED